MPAPQRGLRGAHVLHGGCGALYALALVACATGPAVPAPSATAALPPTKAVRVEDAHGGVATRRSSAVARRIDPAADKVDLLARHLARVDAELKDPLVLGNAAHQLVDGPATYRAMFDAIGRAQRTIHLETYILEASALGQQLADQLEAKRRQGVKVRVLYDSVGSAETPAEYFDALRDAGIAVCEFNPINPLKAEGDPRLRLNNRDHRKLLVIDGTVAFTGGINISGVYGAGSFGSRHKTPSKTNGWRDTHVLVKGPVVAQFARLFDDSWDRQRCPGPLSHEAIRPPPAGTMAMRAVAADPASGRSELYLALMSALDHARARVRLTYGYFVPDDRTVEALTDAARRGVDVRLVLPGFSDFWAPFHAGRSHYDELLNAGVRIFERRDALLHAKTAVVDGVWASVGSTNLDWRSFVHNFEADVLVLDGGFGDEMEKLFALDESASHEVTVDEWKRRGLRDRFLEWLARRWEYVL